MTRRAIAILLTLAFSWMLILPVLATSPDSNLPACCRKNGSHHCAMGTGSPSAAGPAFEAVAQKCPLFPHSTLAAHVETFTPALSPAIFAGAAGHPAVSSQSEAGYRASHLRSKEKRGPPSFFLA